MRKTRILRTNLTLMIEPITCIWAEILSLFCTCLLQTCQSKTPDFRSGSFKIKANVSLLCDDDKGLRVHVYGLFSGKWKHNFDTLMKMNLCPISGVIIAIEPPKHFTSWLEVKDCFLLWWNQLSKFILKQTMWERGGCEQTLPGHTLFF